MEDRLIPFKNLETYIANDFIGNTCIELEDIENELSKQEIFNHLSDLSFREFLYYPLPGYDLTTQRKIYEVVSNYIGNIINDELIQEIVYDLEVEGIPQKVSTLVNYDEVFFQLQIGYEIVAWIGGLKCLVF